MIVADTRETKTDIAMTTAAMKRTTKHIAVTTAEVKRTTKKNDGVQL